MQIRFDLAEVISDVISNVMYQVRWLVGRRR